MNSDYGLDTLGGFFNPVLEFLQTGFAEVNAPAGLIIGLIAVMLMQRWGQLWAVTFVAAIVYALVDHFLPILQNNATLQLPNVTEVSFWQTLAARYVGLLIIIAMFFAVKTVLFGRNAPAAKGH